MPLVPQAWFEVPATQSPLRSQQPVAQVLGPHAGVPPPAPPPPALPPPAAGLSQTPLPLQMRPGPQMTQATPPWPQAARVVPPWQTPFMSQHPAGHVCGLQPLAMPPPAPPMPPAAPPPVAEPPAPPSVKNEEPPPAPTPPSTMGVWHVPALQTWPGSQFALVMQRTGIRPPHALTERRMKQPPAATMEGRRIGRRVLLQNRRQNQLRPLRMAEAASQLSRKRPAFSASTR
jgi:hypothetical protein